MRAYQCVTTAVCVSIFALSASNAQEVSLARYNKLVQRLDELEDRLQIASEEMILTEDLGGGPGCADCGGRCGGCGDSCGVGCCTTGLYAGA